MMKNTTRGRAGRGGAAGRMISRALIIGCVSLATAGWLLAHNGEDHGDAAPAPASAPASPGGGIAVPKEQQFALGVLTEPIATREMAGRATVTGRVVPRTDGVADVVAPIAAWPSASDERKRAILAAIAERPLPSRR